MRAAAYVGGRIDESAKAGDHDAKPGAPIAFYPSQYPVSGLGGVSPFGLPGAEQRQAYRGMPPGALTYGAWRTAANDYGMKDYWARDRQLRIGGILVFVGSAIVLTAVILGFFLTLWIATSFGGSLIPTESAFCVCGASSFEVALGLLGLGAGYYIKDDSLNSTILAIVAGSLLVLLSLIFLGGLLGIIGAVIMIIGGVTVLPS
jgi:hypothetical protein